MESYVKYNGKYWRWWGLTKSNGDYLLESLVDDGAGVSAPAMNVKPAEPHQVDAIRYFENGGQEFPDEVRFCPMCHGEDMNKLDELSEELKQLRRKFELLFASTIDSRF